MEEGYGGLSDGEDEVKGKEVELSSREEKVTGWGGVTGHK